MGRYSMRRDRQEVALGIEARQGISTRILP